MAMPDRDLRIEELVNTVFLAEHICSRNPFELDPAVSTEQASLLMQLYELDQAPVAGSGGSQIVLRMNLDVDRSGKKVGQYAVDTPAEHWVDHNSSLHHTLKQLIEHGWLFVRANRSLLGTIGRQDLGRPTISAYLLAVILGLERGLRRLYGSYQGRPIPDEPKPHVSQQDACERPDNFTTTIKHTLGCDKLLRDLGFKSVNKGDRALQRINKMRNHLAHARTILECGTDTADVLRRIGDLELLAGRVRQLLVDREAIWTAYCATEIISTEGPSTVFAGSGAARLPISTPAHVISAQNPYEHFLGEEENFRRTEILGRYLRSKPEVEDLVRVFGRSTDPNSTWKEECWAVSGLNRSQAVEIGRLFQQRAIFELTDNATMVISSDETVMNTSPRCSA
jgi:Protein of unknown function (DUF3293)